MERRERRCDACGRSYTYYWEGMGQLESEICLDCLRTEVKEAEDPELHRVLTESRWVNTLG